MAVSAPDYVSLSETMQFHQIIVSTSFRANILIVCDGVTVNSVVDELRLLHTAGWYGCRIPGVLDTPSVGYRTVLLYDVSQLTVLQQIALSDWLALGRGRSRVISVSQVSLFDRVESGGFLEGLYYRLNTVTVRASRGNGWQR